MSTKKNPYSSFDFWKVYNRLYWPDLNDSGLISVAKSIAEHFKNKKEIKVLVLGIGTGTFELPVLHHLAKKTGITIQITAVEKAPEPLKFVGMLLENGLEKLPASNSVCQDVLAAYESKWSMDLPGNRQPLVIQKGKSQGHMLIVDDLDYEYPSNSKSYPEKIFTHFPSRWAANLDSQLNDRKEFDLVFASFILLHLDWWRLTLIETFRRMSEGGLFLYETLTGDEHLFEGRLPGTDDHSNELAKEIFINKFFSNSKVREAISRPRDISATHPFNIDSFLGRLEKFGISRKDKKLTKDLSCKICTSPDRNTYLGLLKTRGFSTYQEIDQVIGAETYNRLIEQIEKEEVCEPNKTDNLEFDVKWHVLELRNKKKLTGSPLFQKFSFPGKPGTVGKKEKVFSNKSIHDREYEMQNVLCLTYQDENPGILANKLASDLTRRGSLNKCCLGGDFGFITYTVQSPIFSIFTNPLSVNKEILKNLFEQTWLYLAILSTGNFTGFSNTRLLCQEIMPHSTLPCIFSYCHDESFSVEMIAYSHFIEIRFKIPAIDEKEEFADNLEKLFQSIEESFNEMEINKDITHTFSIPVKAPNESLMKKIEEFTEGYFKDFEVDEKIKALKKQLLDSPAGIELVEALEKNISPQLVRSLYSVNIIKDFKQLVIFPAVFFFEGRPFAREVAIYLYDNILDRDSLEFEYFKIQQVFESIGRNRSNAFVKANISHRLPSTLGAIIEELSRQKKEKNLDLVIPIAAKALWLWESLAKENEIPAWDDEMLHHFKDLNIAGWFITESGLRMIWNDLVVPIASKRILQSPEGALLADPLGIMSLELKVVLSGNLECRRFKDIGECKVLLVAFLLCFLEAYQHTYQSFIRVYHENKEAIFPQKKEVRFDLDDKEIRIINPIGHKDPQSPWSSPGYHYIERLKINRLLAAEIKSSWRFNEPEFDKGNCIVRFTKGVQI